MLWLWLTGLASATPLTLNEALGRALEHNPELRTERMQVEIIDQRLISARGAYDPDLALGVSTGGSSTPSNDVVDGSAVVTTTSQSMSAGLSQALPTGGSVSAGFDQSVTTSDSANAASSRYVYDTVSLDLRQPLLRGLGQGVLVSVRDANLAVIEGELSWRLAVEDVMASVSSAYWGLVQADQGVTNADRALELAQDQLEETLERQREGFAGSGEVLQVQLAVGAARQQQVEAVAAREGAEASLKRLIGADVSPGEGLEPVDGPIVPEMGPARDEVLATARAANATLQLAQIAHEKARRSAASARNTALPSLDLDGYVGASGGAETSASAREQLLQNPAPTYGLGVSLGLPILLREARSAYAIASYELDQAEIALATAEQDLVLDVDDALRELATSRVSLEVASETLDVARLSLEAQQELLEDGRGSTRDVVDALESLRLAEGDEIDAKIRLQNSVNELSRVTGTLVEDLALDPQAAASDGSGR